MASASAWRVTHFSWFQQMSSYKNLSLWLVYTCPVPSKCGQAGSNWVIVGSVCFTVWGMLETWEWGVRHKPVPTTRQQPISSPEIAEHCTLTTTQDRRHGAGCGVACIAWQWKGKYYEVMMLSKHDSDQWELCNFFVGNWMIWISVPSIEPGPVASDLHFSTAF